MANRVVLTSKPEIPMLSSNLEILTLNNNNQEIRTLVSKRRILMLNRLNLLVPMEAVENRMVMANKAMEAMVSIANMSNTILENLSKND